MLNKNPDKCSVSQPKIEISEKRREELLESFDNEGSGPWKLGPQKQKGKFQALFQNLL